MLVCLCRTMSPNKGEEGPVLDIGCSVPSMSQRGAHQNAVHKCLPWGWVGDYLFHLFRMVAGVSAW